MDKNRKGFWGWLRREKTTAETEAYFKVGERVKIYTRPVQQDGFEGIAELIEFVGNDDYEGLPVERWKVRFDNEIQLYERIIVKKISPLLSRMTEMLEEPSAVLKNVSGKEQTGTETAADIEYELAFKYPAGMILFNPRTDIVWSSSETTNLKGIKVLVHSDQQADWVRRTNGVPVKAAREPFPEVPKAEPKVKIAEIAEGTKNKTKSEVPKQGISQ